MKNVIRIVAAALLVIFVALAWLNDWFDYLTIENLIGVKQQLGPWAPVAFILAFAVGEMLQVPSVFWVLCAGLIWPIWIAFPLSLFAALLSATLAFLMARYILGDNFHEKLPRRLEKLSQGLHSAPLKSVVLIRLTTFLHPIVHWVLAASSIRLPVFLLGTAIGIFPGVLAIVVLGQSFVSWWDQYATWIVVVVVILIAGYVLYRRRLDETNG